MKTYKGKYRPQNPHKYKGDPTNIVYRSLWERKVMTWLDGNPNILEWNSEEIVIPYVKPTDNRVHRYFPDFWARMRTKDGIIKEVLIEVKPKKETVAPTKKSKITKKYIQEVTTWGTNQSKWKSAREYCLDRGWEFHIITEDHLNL